MGVLRNLQFALRSLRRTPGYTLAATLTIALGIGATTAMFTVVNAVVLRPLPFPGSERVMRICETNPAVDRFCVASAPNVADWARQARTLEAAGVARNEMFVLRSDGRSVGVRGAIASPGFFATLGLTAAHGRLFTESDLDAGRNQVAVVSHAFWVQRLGADPGAVGAVVVLDGHQVRIVGVLPAEAFIPEPASVDVWKPLTASIDDTSNRSWRGFVALGRAVPGKTQSAVLAELDTVRARLADAYPESNRDWGLRSTPLREAIAGPVGPTLWAFLAAALLLWLIACANVGSLLMMRTTGRAREFAVRRALGAGRARLASQLLAESLVVAGTGGVAGLAIAAVATRLLLRQAPPGIPRLGEVSIDATVAGFALVAAFFAALIFAAAAVRRAMRDSGSELAGGARLTGGPPAGSRQTVVIAQTAMAFVLVVGAGLLTRAFVRLVAWDPGFDRHGVVVSWLSAPTGADSTAAAAVAALERARDAVAVIPGVTQVGLGSAGPLFGGVETGTLVVEGAAARSGVVVNWHDVDPNYMSALGRRVLRGRDFVSGDVREAAHVAIVNETLARQVFGVADSLGRRISVDGHASEIVGVVSDVRPSRPDAAVEPEVFWPIRQYPRFGAYLVARAGPDAIEPLVRAAVERDAPDIQLGAVRSLDELFDRTLVTPRFSLLLIGTFAACAAVLAGIGLYGVVAYGVSTRTRELGVRIALGAAPGTLVRSLLWHSAGLAARGVAVGLIAAYVAGRFVSGMLYGVPAHDPLTMAATVAGFTVVTAIAAFQPARRVTRIDPVTALKAE